jgi:hypothetical protein
MTRHVTDQHLEAQGGYTGAETETYYAQHDFRGSAKLSTTIVIAVSEVAEADETDTESTLFQHVDPDALDDLFCPAGSETPRTSGHVNLHVWGHDVTVYSNGQIVISAPR